MIEKIVEWSNIARKQGLLGLESAVEQEKDEFLKKGLQSLVDGGEPEAIRSSMEIELDTMEHFDTQAAKVFEAMGVYSPTLGIIGAVMGLMAVMQNLADPSKLGHGIAAAFVATIYGIAFANLLFLPMGNKLKVGDSRPIAGSNHGHRGHHRDRPGREPAQHRIAIARLLSSMMPQRGGRRKTKAMARRRSTKACEYGGLGHSLWRPRDPAVRLVHGHVRHVLGERRQVPRAVRLDDRGISRRAEDPQPVNIGEKEPGKGGDKPLSGSRRRRS